MHHFPSEIYISFPAQQHGPARPGANGDCVDRHRSRFVGIRICNLYYKVRQTESGLVVRTLNK